MIRTLFYASIWILVFLLGCAPLAKFAKSDGDRISVVVGEGIISGEFIAITADSLYVLVESMDPMPIQSGNVRLRTSISGKVLAVSQGSVRAITVHGYVDRSWILGVSLLSVVPAVLLGAAASMADESGFAVSAILLIPSGLFALLFSAITPRSPGVNAPLTEAELDQLRKFARYPLGLNGSQLQRLRQTIGQQEGLKLAPRESAPAAGSD